VTAGPDATALAAKRRRRRILRRPPTHWFVLVVALAVLVVMLGTSAVLQGADEERAVGAPALAGGSATGPVLDLSGDRLRSGRPDDRTIGLAIIGLPDGGEADRVLDLLRDHDVDATWFVSGRDATGRPSLLRRILRAGGEVGVIGHGGRDLGGEPAWRTRFELSVTQAALAARVGRTAPLLVLPATPHRADLDRAALRTARTAAARGHLLVAGAPAADAATGDVAVVPTDGGRQPLAEVRALLGRARAEGADVAPVGRAAGLDPAEVNPRPDGWTRANGWLVLGAVASAELVADLLPWLFYPITALVALRALLAVVLGLLHAVRRRTGPAWTGPLSVVVPAYDEAAGIASTLRSLVASTWAHGLEVVVVDDGSTDGTADIAEGLDLPGVRVIRQQNTGKPGALNTGIAASTGDVLVLLDGDTVFEPGTIAALVAPFADPRIGAVSGNAKVANRRSLLGTWQHIEYVMGFNLDRRMLDVVRGIATIPGAVGAFRREALAEVGGLSDDTIAEDTDLTIGISRRGWTVAYRADAVAWTEAPSSVDDLWKQRYRWSYGVLQAVWKHRGAMLEPRPIGPVGLTYTLLFQVAVGLLAPLVDVAALLAALTGDRTIVVTWLGFVAVQVAMAALALRLDGESLRPLWAVPLQQLFYRQLMYLVVIQSLGSAVVGARLRWHKLHRVGIESLPTG